VSDHPRLNLSVPIVFALLAGLTRLSLTETYSRYQVLAFAAVAVLFELIRNRDYGPKLQVASYTANVMAAFAAIVFVKWQLEGISLSHWARLVAETV
jgi:hypothetical protein